MYIKQDQNAKKCLSSGPSLQWKKKKKKKKQNDRLRDKLLSITKYSISYIIYKSQLIHF